MALMTGGCHCGNIAVFFETDIMPEETEPRACQCSFCRKHQSRAVSDPDGSLRITVAEGDLLSRYRFGLKSIDFLVCRACGVYLAVEETHAMPSVSCAEQLISALGKAVDMTGHAPVMLPSGAGHDAMAMASLCETGMLFVRCRDGLSHNPEEAISQVDAHACVEAILNFIRTFEPVRNAGDSPTCLLAN